MITINMQYFGSRGSSSGKSGGGAKAQQRMAEIKEVDAYIRVPEGKYIDPNGEETNIHYIKTENGIVMQAEHPSSIETYGSVTYRPSTKDYRVDVLGEESRRFTSPKRAAQYGFGSLRSLGLKRAK